MRDLLLKNLCPRFAPLAVIAVAAVALVSCADASHTIDATSEKRARIIIAEDTRTISNELLGYLDDPEPAVRALACRAVGRIGVADRSDSEIVEILWPHLQDTSAQVVTSVVFAFGLLPDNAELANRLVEFAMTAPPDAAHAALVSAGRIGDSASVPLLQKLTIFLNHQRPGYRSRAALALFLAGFTGSGDALSQVALGDSVKTVRDTALYALVRLRDTRARDVYLSYLDDPDDYLQALAARGLAAVADTLLVPRLSVLLQGADPNLRSQVITSLSSLKCAASEKALAWRAENETDERLAAQALRALAQYDNQAHRRLALDRIAEDNSLEMDAAIVAYLSGTLRRNTDRELEVLVASGDERLAEVFLNSLNRSLEKRKLKALIQRRLRDAPGPAHYAAYALCREINLELDDWMTSARLAKILKQGGDPLIVAAALEHAGHRREPWFFDAALSLARNPEKIPAQNRQDVFLSILDAAESMLADEAEPSEQARVNAREVFEKCLAMADFTISARAAEALKENFAEDRGSEIVKP
ncbi:MAG: HEAT repeat domain-containing protein, partial [Candidatus Zixiibacteriota bacterium]